MSVRVQTTLGEADDRALTEEQRRTGLTVSELLRRAIQQCYGQGAKFTRNEVFAHSVQVGSATEDEWVYDPLFDGDYVDRILEADRDVRQ